MVNEAVNLNVLLPVEVLTAILVDCIVDDPRFTSPPSRANVYLADVALSISHVCQLWRNISLGPGGRRLWAHAPLRHKAPCVEVFMNRSQPLPVFLKIEAVLVDGVVPISPSIPAVEAALHYSARVATMILKFNIEEFSFPDEIMNEYLTKYERISDMLDEYSFPALEYLFWSPWTNDEGEALSESVFRMEVPRSLRRLFLSNTDFTTPSPVLGAPLTSLILEHSGGWLGVDNFVDTLLNMPSLETLAILSEGLHDTFHTSATSVRHPYRSIALPHLTRLAIYDSLSNVPLLIAYIRVPIACRIHLELGYQTYRSDPDHYWEHWDVVQLTLRAHFESSSFDRLVLSGSGDDEDRFMICASSPRLPTLDLHFHCDDPAFSRKDKCLLRTLRDLITLPFLSHASTVIVQNIRVLSPSLYDPRDSYDGRLVSSPFSAVRQVTATHPAGVDGLLHALFLNPDRPLLPSLQSIELRQISFCNWNNPHISEPTFTALLDALVARRYQASVQPVKTIRFRRCGLTQAALDALAEAANAEGSWDGRNVSPNQLMAMKYDHFSSSTYETEHDGVLEQILKEGRSPY